MFISDNYNFVFFEVPRTGSNSVSAALAQFDPDSETVLKRTQINVTADYHDFILPTQPQDPYIVFAAHRNPYARLWSFWKHRHRNGNPAVFRTTSWPRYVEWVCDPDSVPEIQNAMLDIPISEMFDCDRIDYWIRFESLIESWKNFGQEYGFDLPKLEIKQSSPDMGTMQNAYDQEMAAKVANRFAADFERFNYDTDSWSQH